MIPERPDLPDRRRPPGRSRLELAALAASLLLHAGVAAAAVVAAGWSLRGAEVGVGEMNAIEVVIVEGSHFHGGEAELAVADDQPISVASPAETDTPSPRSSEVQASSTTADKPSAPPPRHGEAPQTAGPVRAGATAPYDEASEPVAPDIEAVIPPPPARKPADIHVTKEAATAGKGEDGTEASPETAAAIEAVGEDDAGEPSSREVEKAHDTAAGAAGEDDVGESSSREVREAHDAVTESAMAAKGGGDGDETETAARDRGSPGEQLAAAPRASNPPPRYPDGARRRGWEGRVILEVEVTADGHSATVRLADSSGYDVLDAAAIEAVRSWRFTPAERDGSSVASVVRVPVRFALEAR